MGATKWGEKALQTFFNKEELSRFVIYADNPAGEESENFKQPISKLKGCFWFQFSRDSLLTVVLHKPSNSQLKKT